MKTQLRPMKEQHLALIAVAVILGVALAVDVLAGVNTVLTAVVLLLVAAAVHGRRRLRRR